MKFSNFVSFFIFSKAQAKGILLLFSIIIILQLFIFFFDFRIPLKSDPEKEKWMAIQLELDVEKKNLNAQKQKVFPFNPNFISDYKGYKLGMSVAEIDRLHAFRDKNNYVNSAEDFQKVTLVSDSLLKELAPYFKFPSWVTKRNSQSKGTYNQVFPKQKQFFVQKDINLATKEDLIAVFGIGETLASRIMLEKERFGVFLSMEQFQFIWGLQPEAIRDLQKKFTITSSSIASFKKIAVNDLSIKELSKFPYFNYSLAKEIVKYRSMNGDIKEIADLTKIKGMPNDKIKIIALYLEF
jgi:DNA uptake protein ComE-like DNA-binding protein